MNPIQLFRANDPFEQLISQILVVESEPQSRLEDERDKQDRLKKVMSDLDSKLSAMHKLVKNFTSTFSSPFAARTAVVNDTSSFSVSATDKAAFGSHTLEVHRLARADTRISKQFTAAGGDLRAFFDANGAQTFSIDVKSPTEEDPDNRISISVTVDPEGTTDEEILKEIQAEIGRQMNDARDAGTIKKDERAVASVVNETTGTARLSLRSGQTGYSNRLEFTDSGDGLLALLEATNAGVASGTGGGMVTDVGTGELDSELNSKFTLDGLTLYRDANSVSDALDGITIDLKEAGDGPKDFSVSADKDSIKGEVEDFIKKYNEILHYIQGKSTVDGESGARGDLAGDSVFRSLRFDMRNDIALQVTGQPAEAPQYLRDLGIKIESDGSLKLDDVDQLLAAVEKDADAVGSLFSSENGIATRLKERIDRFVGTKGLMNERKKSIDTKIKRLKDRISGWDERLARREESLRMQFAKLQESMATLQSQQQNFMGFFGGGGGGF